MPKLGDLIPNRVRRDLVEEYGKPALTYRKTEFLGWMDRKAQQIEAEAARRFPGEPEAQQKWYRDEIDRTIEQEMFNWKRQSARIQALRHADQKHRRQLHNADRLHQQEVDKL